MELIDNKQSAASNIAEEDPISEETALLSIEEYRKVLCDYKSSDEDIIRRLKYLETLCRHVIRQELQRHAEES